MVSWTVFHCVFHCVFHVDLDLDLVEFLCQRFEWCLQFWGADMPRARKHYFCTWTRFGFELYWHEFQRVIHVAWALVLSSLMPQPFAQDLMACQRHYEPSLGLRFWEVAKASVASFLGLRWLGQLDWESLVLDQPWSKRRAQAATTVPSLVLYDHTLTGKTALFVQKHLTQQLKAGPGACSAARQIAWQ